MANNIQTVFDVVFKANTADFQGQAGQIASMFASSFDQVFSQLADRFKDALTRAVSQGMPAVLTDPSGRTLSVVPRGGARVVGAEGPEEAGVQQAPQAAYAFSRPRIFRPEQQETLEQLIERAKPTRYGSLIQETQAMTRMRDQGVGPPLSDQDRQRMEGLQASALQASMRLNERIAELNTKMDDNARQIDTNTIAIKDGSDVYGTLKASTETLAKSNLELKQETEKLTREEKEAREMAHVAGEAAKTAPAQQPGISTAFKAGVILQGVGSMIQAMPEIEMGARRAEASKAELDNMQARMFMRGEFEKLFALEQLGGPDRARGTARRMGIEEIIGQGVSGVGGLLTGQGVGAGGLAALLSLNPLTRGITSLMGGASNVVGLDTKTQGRLSEMLGIQGELNAEQMMALRSGREAAVGAFRSAQQMGAPEGAGFIAGQPGMDVGGMNIRQFAVRQAAITNQQFTDTMATLFQGMGGSFGGLQRPGMLGSIGELMKAQGQGFTGAPQFATQMFQSMGAGAGVESDQRRALDMTRQMFEEAVAAGLDKAAVGKALLSVSARAQQLGVGGAEIARAEFERSMAMSQALFGTQTTDAQRQFTQGALERAENASRSTGNIIGAFGLKATQDVSNRFGLNLSGGEQEYLRTVPQDEDSIRMFLQRTGRSGDARAISEALKTGAQTALFRGLKGQIPGRAGAELAMIQALGPKTGVEAEEILRMGELQQGEMPRSAVENLEGQLFDNASRMPRGREEGFGDQQRKMAVATEVAGAEAVAAGLKTMGEQVLIVNEALDLFAQKLGVIAGNPVQSNEDRRNEQLAGQRAIENLMFDMNPKAPRASEMPRSFKYKGQKGG